jgi:CRP-like cAMP-binding protein
LRWIKDRPCDPRHVPTHDVGTAIMNLVEGLDRFGRAVGGTLARSGIPACPSLRDRLRPLARHLTAPQGHSAMLDPGHDHLVYLLEGHAKLVAQTPGGEDRIVAFHCAGDLVTVPAAALHAYALVAIRDCNMLVFGRTELLSAVHDDPAVLEAVFSQVIDGLERCRENAVNLGRKSASKRVASFLLTMAKRTGREPGGAVVVDLPMSRRDVSDYLGLTIETISRQISEMRKKGLIATPSRTRVELLDFPALKMRASHFAGAA